MILGYRRRVFTLKQVMYMTICGAKPSTHRRLPAMDVVYLGVALLFFALTWGLVWLCERL